MGYNEDKMNYTASGVIGAISTLVFIEWNATIEALFYGGMGALGALIIRALWGLAEKVIKARRGNKNI